MAHCLILGTTESGKTTLAKRLSAKYKSAGYGVLVLDPLGDPQWTADYITDDAEEFLGVFWNSRQCAAFIDEAGESVGRYNEVMHKTATRGRHWGHSCHYISQRGVQIAPTVRDQCSHIFLFTTAFDDAKTHANEWNKPGMKEANALPQGHYYHATRFGQLEKGQLW